MPLFGDLGIVELLILIFIIVIIFYPKRMRDIVKNFGIAVKAFKEGVREVEAEINEEGGSNAKKRGQRKSK